MRKDKRTVAEKKLAAALKTVKAARAARAAKYKITLDELTEIEFSVSNESFIRDFLVHETAEESCENARHYRMTPLELGELKLSIIEERF